MSAQTTDSEAVSQVNSAPSGAATRASVIDESTLILGEPVAPASPTGDTSIFLVIRMVVVLALAALAIYGVVFFIKRLAKPQMIKDPHLKVLARTALSNDTYAAVLSLGRKAWLVAGGSGSVNLISEVEEGEALETMLLEEDRIMAETGNKSLLDFRSIISKLTGSPGQKKDLNSHTENLRRQRGRLGGP